MPHFSHKTRTARKAHECSTCDRRIEPGEVYRVGVGFDDGTAWTWKDCPHCEAVLKHWHDSVCPDEFYNGQTFADWIEYRFETDGVTVSELRAMAGFRKKWRTASGALWPIPTPENQEQPHE